MSRRGPYFERTKELTDGRKQNGAGKTILRYFWFRDLCVNEFLVCLSYLLRMPHMKICDIPKVMGLLLISLFLFYNLSWTLSCHEYWTFLTTKWTYTCFSITPLLVRKKTANNLICVHVDQPVFTRVLHIYISWPRRNISSRIIHGQKQNRRNNKWRIMTVTQPQLCQCPSPAGCIFVQKFWDLLA